MKWTHVAIKAIQEVITQQQRITVAKEKIKGGAVHIGINTVGGILFAVLTIASIIMIFADLGTQWNNQNVAHFSGGIQAAVLMFVFGAVIFGACLGISHLIAKHKEEDLAVFKAQHDFNPITLFGKEFVRELKRNLDYPSTPRQRAIERVSNQLRH